LKLRGREAEDIHEFGCGIETAQGSLDVVVSSDEVAARPLGDILHEAVPLVHLGDTPGIRPCGRIVGVVLDVDTARIHAADDHLGAHHALDGPVLQLAEPRRNVHARGRQNDRALAGHCRHRADQPCESHEIGLHVAISCLNDRLGEAAHLVFEEDLVGLSGWADGQASCRPLWNRRYRDGRVRSRDAVEHRGGSAVHDPVRLQVSEYAADFGIQWGHVERRTPIHRAQVRKSIAQSTAIPGKRHHHSPGCRHDGGAIAKVHIHHAADRRQDRQRHVLRHQILIVDNEGDEAIGDGGRACRVGTPCPQERQFVILQFLNLEARNGLLLSGIEQLEVFLRQARDRLALNIADDGGDFHDSRAGFEGGRGLCE
jgi:hypothetical protein